MGHAGSVLLTCTAILCLIGCLFPTQAVTAGEYGVNWDSLSTPDEMHVGRSYVASVTVTNTGATTWPASGPNPVQLSYHWYYAGGELAEWDGERTPLSSDVHSGASITVAAVVVAPTVPGRYLLTWDLVHDGVTWFSTAGCPTADEARDVGAEYRVTWNGTYAPQSMEPGGTYYVNVRLTNSGDFAWSSLAFSPICLSYHWYTVSGHVVVWDGERSVFAADVAPGQTATVSARVTAPDSPGKYTLHWDLVQDGITWFESQAESGGWPYNAANEEVVRVGSRGRSGWLPWWSWMIVSTLMALIALTIVVAWRKKQNLSIPQTGTPAKPAQLDSVTALKSKMDRLDRHQRRNRRSGK